MHDVLKFYIISTHWTKFCSIIDPVPVQPKPPTFKMTQTYDQKPPASKMTPTYDQKPLAFKMTPTYDQKPLAAKMTPTCDVKSGTYLINKLKTTTYTVDYTVD